MEHFEVNNIKASAKHAPLNTHQLSTHIIVYSASCNADVKPVIPYLSLKSTLEMLMNTSPCLQITEILQSSCNILNYKKFKTFIIKMSITTKIADFDLNQSFQNEEKTLIISFKSLRKI